VPPLFVDLDGRFTSDSVIRPVASEDLEAIDRISRYAMRS